MSALVRLDLNIPDFQEDLLELTRDQQVSLLAAFRKITRLTWEQVYRDKGLRWEAVKSHSGPNKERVFSIRIDRQFRALVLRDGPRMQFLSLHPDHDSAYAQ